MEKAEKVANLDNEVEAQLLESVLGEQGIPHVIRSYHDLVYDGVYQMQKGWGCVTAPPEWKEEILRHLEILRTAQNDNSG